MQKPKKKKRTKPNSMDTLYRKRGRALNWVIALCKKGEDVNGALDALTLAHTAVTFKFVGG